MQLLVTMHQLAHEIGDGHDFESMTDARKQDLLVIQSLFFGATLLIASYLQLAFNNSWYWSMICYVIYSLGVFHYVFKNELYHPLLSSMIMVFALAFISLILMIYTQVRLSKFNFLSNQKIIRLLK